MIPLNAKPIATQTDDSMSAFVSDGDFGLVLPRIPKSKTSNTAISAKK